MIEVFQMLQKAKTHAMPLGNHVTQQKLTETTENRSALTKHQILAFSGSFQYILLYLGVIPPHSGVIPARSGIFRHHSCSFVSFRHIPVYSVPFLCLVTPVLLVYSALFCCHSASFRYILVPFLFIPSHSGVIRFYSRVIPPCSGIFRFISVYSALFVCHSASFRCHSGSFRYIPVPFLFRFISVYSVPFRSCV